jgi:hypothetical protein
MRPPLLALFLAQTAAPSGAPASSCTFKRTIAECDRLTMKM